MYLRSRSTARSPKQCSRRSADASPAGQSSIRDISDSADKSYVKRQDSSIALHASQFEIVVGRDEEINILEQSLGLWLSERRSGCVYVSGAPGTGKTATVSQVVRILSAEKKCRSIFLNCMHMTSPRAVYTCILEKLCEKFVSKAPEKIVNYVEIQLAKISRRLPLIMVLDEIDQLALQFNDVLFT